MMRRQPINLQTTSRGQLIHKKDLGQLIHRNEFESSSNDDQCQYTTTSLSTNHGASISLKLIMNRNTYQDFNNSTRTRIEIETRTIGTHESPISHHSSYSHERNIHCYVHYFKSLN
ncbi:uncharacterized protein J8A68_002704 [[Candida] subhashii]|uniref:Uncharacterized protein n=1 Tax=[Candida] subhashii TaxID=561895 RepID=A0A8J5V0F8_9ASCO|nr:uncharacterized protein J8A68_002704 [[Candida] subhashii]KAG7663844.1 hypothetical protein J8A68_002704 [[Candida] subhashii]